MNRSRWTAAALAAAGALVLTAAGCGNDGESSSSDKPVIGISVKTITNDPFQSAWVSAAEEKVGSQGGEALVLTAGGQTAVANQVSQINDLISREVDAMIVNPIDGAAVLPALQKAKAAGIPVVIVDSPVEDGNEDLYETFIATDNVKAGRDLATYLVDNIDTPQPQVAIIEGAPGSKAGDDRKEGFLAGLDSGGVQPVASASGEWSSDKALIAMENILTAHPDLDAVLSASDVMVEGILQALRASDRSDVKVLSIDGSKVGIQGVIDGDLFADNTQDPIRMGTLAAENAVGLADGSVESGSLEKYVDSGTETVTADNAEDALAKAF
jgi:ribose transport system substrate-binding protein